MAPLTPLAVAELHEAIDVFRTSLNTASGLTRADRLKLLRSLHEALIRATRGTDHLPAKSLAAAAAAIAPLPRGLTDALAPRPSTVFRLLRAEAYQAAWQVLIDNGTGYVAEPYAASTATGVVRTAWRLPLLTRIEAGTVYAELPGFRDPRVDAADDCYDITRAIRLRVGLDELVASDSVMTLGGWAALDVFTAESSDRVAVVLASGDPEIRIAGQRVRRADLVAGRAEALTRRAWAGWSAEFSAADLPSPAARWVVSVELDHHGVIHSEPLGAAVGELAAAASQALYQWGEQRASWVTDGSELCFVIDESVTANEATPDAVGG